ncbi:hypothetical protein B0T25DRAFT_545220 [Lasiosphaeria hispida]|uniref:Uncharacterized protein n=1 Tax=Lasiosphaeria hispida TaxID=260671 RepID=A0AAJ0HJW4_9PEZI|nr:hypothetical protein B0T25DRAFT_545220 [Lasiosphaeria hispida]
MSDTEDSITVEPVVDLSTVNSLDQSADDWLEESQVEPSYPQDRGFRNTTPFSQSGVPIVTPTAEQQDRPARATAGRRKPAPSGPPPEKKQGKRKSTVAIVRQQDGQQQQRSTARKVELRNQPLGNEEVYESVFWRAMATGEHILEPGDATQRDLMEFLQRDTQDLSDGTGSADSGCYAPYLVDSEDSEEESINSGAASQAVSQLSSVGPISARARRLTPAQQRRIGTNLDIPPIGGSQPAAAVAVPANSRRSKDFEETEAAVVGRSMREAAEIIAGLPGARDLALAVEDLQAEFAGKISDEEMLCCCEYLRKEPMMAAMWLKLLPGLKILYVARWKIGPVE